MLLLLLLIVQPAAADDIRDQQWHLATLGIPQAQKISQGDGVIVAVLDTGVDTKHAELAGAVLPGKGFGEGNNTDGRFDPVGHGTAMAGLIAGRGLPNGGGVLGIAPKSTILPLQVVRSDTGLAVPRLFAEGIDWAVDHGAKVINISADTSEDPQVREAVERALRSDVVVVAAVGNAPAQTTIAFPARLPGVVAVGGTDRNGDHAAVSATGPEMMVAAPAVDIVSTSPAGQYTRDTGTSDATAIVSGVVALVRAKYPTLPAPEVVRRITATATDKGKPGRDPEFGYGIVNPVAALTAELPPPSPSAARKTSAPPTEGGGRTGASWAVGTAAVAAILIGGLILARRRAARD
jgi:type VII secretion-associated serine protease mycosin